MCSGGGITNSSLGTLVATVGAGVKGASGGHAITAARTTDRPHRPQALTALTEGHRLEDGPHALGQALTRSSASLTGRVRLNTQPTKSFSLRERFADNETSKQPASPRRPGRHAATEALIKFYCNEIDNCFLLKTISCMTED